MAPCEMCGKQDELVRASIENVIMSVCSSCSKYGKVLGRERKFLPEKKPKPQPKEILEEVIPEYAAVIKSAREKLGLTQLDLGKKIAEHESLLQHIESGKIKPTLDVAGKLEKFFRIKLVEVKEDVIVPSKPGKGEITLGDMVKIRKR
ncbi:MAG: multiprotein bridging factor aMBF1 [Candidatus Woesearchaeota archaeon]